MPTQIVETTDALRSGLTAGFHSFMDFIPALIGGLLVLAIGWIISGIVARIIERVLHAVKFEHVVQKSQLHTYFPARTPAMTGSGIVATLVKWFIRLIFIQAAANILRMPQVTGIINSILLFIPNALVAMVILVIGFTVAKFVAQLVGDSVSRMGGAPTILSLIARYAIVGFAVIMAVNQLGIATNLINILFTGLVGSVALSLALAFGLGGQSVASEITRTWYEQGKSGAVKLRTVPSLAQEKSAKAIIPPDLNKKA